MASPPTKRRRIEYADRRIGCLLDLTGLPRVLVELCLEFIPLPAWRIVDLDPNAVQIAPRSHHYGSQPQRALLTAADGGPLHVLFTNGTLQFPCEYPRQRLFLGLNAKEMQTTTEFYQKLQRRIPTNPGETWFQSGITCVRLTRSHLDQLADARRLVNQRGEPITVDELENATEFETAVVCFKAACFANGKCYLWKSLVFVRVKDKLDPNAWLTYL